MATNSALDRFPSCRLVLVRHGQARSADGSYGRETPLSELGRLQAAAAAESLARRGTPAAVYTSPLPRALGTAEVISVRLGLCPLVEQDLAEFELGTGPLTVAQNRPDLLLWQADDAGVPGGQTLGEFGLRVAGCVATIVERHLDGWVVVVSHSGTMEAVLRWAVGLAPGAPWQSEFDLPNASLTDLECWPRGRVKGGAPRYAAVGPVGVARHLGNLVSEL